ncbi:hypothetical protein BU23DRAFT_483524, partial [Bimuria novae-zelandiae CBS 107.79]
LTNLAKLYTPEQKYLGNKYNILKIKIKVFNNLYTKVRINKDKQYKIVLSIILTS